jgi:hypothetical protein
MQAAPIILGGDIPITEQAADLRGAGERPVFLDLPPAPPAAEGRRA